MKVKNEKEEIKSPSTLTLSGYCTINDHFSIITPNLKSIDSKIILIRLDKFRGGLLGSAYSRFYPTSATPIVWKDRFISSYMEYYSKFN